MPLRADLLDAARRLWRQPGFALVAVVTLALAIGADTALFVLLNAIALRQLPVTRPDELVRVSTSTVDIPDADLSFPLFQALRREQIVFSEVIGAVRNIRGNIEIDGQPSLAFVWCVTGNYYTTLGTRPFAGRLLTPLDAPLEGSRFEPSAVIGYEFWQRRLGGRPILGRTIRLEAIDFTIVGIAPPGWAGTSLSIVPDLVVPLSAAPTLLGVAPDHLFDGSGAKWVEVAGRLRTDVSLDAARVSLGASWPAVRAAAVPSTLTAAQREQFLALPLIVTSAAHGVDHAFTADTARALTISMAIGVLILVLACMNLASLLLCRVTSRAREIGIRLALGASRWVLARGAVAESALVALAGAAGGVIVASWATNAVSAWWAQSGMTRAIPHGIDAGMLLFVGVASLVVVTLVSFAAVSWVARKSVPIADLSRAARPSTRVGRSGAVLVALQIGMSLVVVASATLLARNVAALRHPGDVGYRSDGMSMVHLQPRPNGYLHVDNDRYQRAALEAVAALPGVRGAVFSSGAPFASGMTARMTPTSAGSPVTAPESGLSPGFFALVGMPLLAGRDFTWQDDSRASRVVIVSRSVATALFGTKSALGARIRLRDGPRDQEMEIVGIAADAKIDDAHAPTVMAAYVPQLQTGDDVNWKAMLVRTADGVTPSESSLSNALAAFGHEYVESVRSFDRLVDDELLLEREVAVLASAAAAVALALVVIGVYGLWTLLVLQRRKEMGIRLALGAGGSRVALLVMTGGLRVAGAGIVIGGIGAVFASRVLRSFVTGVSLYDPLSLTLAPVLVLLASAAACLVPAWRAASADPLTSLRAD